MKIPVGEFTDTLGTHELEIDSFHHTFVDGVSGAGKSTFLEDVAIQNIRAGRGIFFLDPHGTSIRRILKYIPRRFSRNVIYFNPLAKKVPGLNFFAFTKKEDRHKAVANARGAKLPEPEVEENDLIAAYEPQERNSNDERTLWSYLFWYPIRKL